MGVLNYSVLFVNASNATRKSTEESTQVDLHPLTPLFVLSVIAIYGLFVYLLVDGYCSYYLKCEFMNNCSSWTQRHPRIGDYHERYTKNPIFNIPISKLSQMQNEVDFKDLTCTICMQTLCDSHNTIVKTACNHHFHLECIQQWNQHQELKTLTRCPICRSDISVLYSQEDIDKEIQA